MTGSSGRTVVFLAVEGKARALVSVSDPVKASAAEAIRHLKAEGLDVVMLTGDNRTVASAVGRALGIDRVVCGMVNTGTGFAKMAHGLYPVPAPATAELLKGIPVRMDSFSETRKELVTPTGALILKHLVDEFAPISMTVERVGYGAGKRDLPTPNVLRGFLGRSSSAETAKRLLLLESNIDNMNPELYGHLMEVLYERGALDVFFTAVQMKKNRPATRVSVLGELQNKDVLVQTLMRESTTIGVADHSRIRRVTSSPSTNRNRPSA